VTGREKGTKGGRKDILFTHKGKEVYAWKGRGPVGGHRIRPGSRGKSKNGGSIGLNISSSEGGLEGLQPGGYKSEERKKKKKGVQGKLVRKKKNIKRARELKEKLGFTTRKFQKITPRRKSV